MNVNHTDRLYYNSAVDYIVEQLEITHSFVRYNGLTSFSSEDISNLAISHAKDWLMSEQGATWLATLGYKKNGDSVLVGSGTAISLADYCPVCSGIYYPADGTTCECCGRTICRPCSTVVDKRYDIEWCETCIQKESLTNILSHDE